MQANTHAVFSDPYNDHWDFISVLNTAHAGELFLKAAIAKEHPLLIFKDIFSLDDKGSEFLDIDNLVRRGRTYDFDKLPQVLWATTGVRISDMQCYERLRSARNSIQHFCKPSHQDCRSLSLEFIYKIIDPLISKQFGLCAIEYHEDHGIGYDYVVAEVLRSELKFTIPDDFDIKETNVLEILSGVSRSYRDWFRNELERIGNTTLYP